MKPPAGARDALVVGVAIVLLAGLAFGMATPPPPGGAAVASPSLPAAAASTQRILREGVIGSVATLNPLFVRTRPEQDIAALVFRGLTKLGPNDAVVPDLASSWTVSKDGKTYRFHLRLDARWQDGAKVTADDVVYTILVLQHPDYQGPLAGQWRGITTKKIDASTVEFHLAAPVATFLAATRQAILPSHLLATTPVADLGSLPFDRQPIGDGPFRVAAISGEHVLLERWLTASELASQQPATFVPGQVPLDPAGWTADDASLDGIDFRLYPDAAHLASAFRAGTVDTAAGLDASTVAGLQSIAGTTVLRYPRSVVTTVALNLRFGQNMFQDAHVRRALLLAVDRDAIVRDVLRTMGVRADTLIPPSSWAFDAKAAGRVPYSPSQAIKELKAAGWKRTKSGWLRPGSKTLVAFDLLTVDVATNPIDVAIANRLVAAWKAIGLRVKLVALPPGQAVTARLVPGKFEAAVMDVNLGLDPDVFPLLASSQVIAGGSNVSGYQSSELDPLLEAARQYASRATRVKRFAALEQGLAKELPMLPLVYGDYLYVVRTRLSGPTPQEIGTGSDRFWDVLTWRLAGAAGT